MLAWVVMICKFSTIAEEDLKLRTLRLLGILFTNTACMAIVNLPFHWRRTKNFLLHDLHSCL